ncbi:MAG TPA: 50S ribosomal protein L18 [Spirochaetia bacterium]|nr:MAG: 50S ribosomal protein L18 [Spirochaetes bacterium GWB1_36_13]HCL57324.1 50S ribosomal protein L18 [Spirochaetia bacterium]
MNTINKNKRRLRRKLSIKNKIRGTEEKPRLTIFRSNKNIYAQIINDTKGITLCAASTMEKELGMIGKCNKAAAAKVGESLGQRAIEKGVKKVVFDRNGYRYHGIVKELADACRKSGLEF